MCCKLCFLNETRKNIVRYRGSMPCDILFVGEAPGKTEDLIGEPFIGASGRLLQSIVNVLAEKHGFTYGFTNCVQCIPKDETGEIRPPSREEIKACSTRFRHVYREASPKIVVLLGKIAKTALYNELYYKAHCLVHPAYILRQESNFNVEKVKFLRKLEELVLTLV